MDIIVVEGIHDVSKIKEVYPNANCVITNGREISEETKKCIKKLSENNTIIIFTDPDSPGEKIRSIITEIVPNAKQAFWRKKDCISSNHRKVGIEHATKKSIKESLENIYSTSNAVETITLNELCSLGLVGSKDSAILRAKLADYLNIGRPNAKTLLKRLNLVGITKDDLEGILCKLK